MSLPRPPLPVLTQESQAVTTELLSSLRKRLPNETIDLIEAFSAEELQEVSVAIAANPTSAQLHALPNLVWLQSLWAGVESLIEPAQQAAFKVVRLVDPELSNIMAEAALAWVFYLHRRMPEYAALQREKRWQPLPWRRAAATRVTVLGAGELGKAASTRLADQGFDVACWSSSPKKLAGISSFHGADQLPNALARSDILVVLLPLTPATQNLLNPARLACLPNGAALINFARGPIIDNAALLAALDSNALQHAVLDVFDQEPLDQQSPLWTHPQVTVLPHIAAPTDPESAVAIAARNIMAYRNNGELPMTVDLAKGF